MNIILFGATGHLGKAIATEAVKRGYAVTAVVRNAAKENALKQTISCNTIVADVTDASSLVNICKGFDVVISALGKSVSINDNSKPGFMDIDLTANTTILTEAVKAGVKKFIYISACHAERYPQLTYFHAHQQFAERLIRTDLDYAIIKPPALFSAFLDLIDLAKKGRLVHIGKGDKLTNPVDEADVAIACINAIHENKSNIEIGGPEILSRKQINEMIQEAVNPGKKIRTIPLGMVKGMLPLVKLINRNLFDKMAFFVEVIQHDTIAPRLGQMQLKEYLERKLSV
ncbi:MAG: SDR family oxidoreductase [Chitinophagaceae bacterium]|nr:SDR family oxidoreductase [Chitinophagaceae bacterium]